MAALAPSALPRPLAGEPEQLASWQYQRMSAQAWPPSGTIRPAGSTMPHKAH